jgi:hypothetical protein
METVSTSAGSTVVTSVGPIEMVEIVIRCDFEGPLWFEDVVVDTADIENDSRERARRFPNQYRIVKVSRSILERWRGAFRTFELIQCEMQAVFGEATAHSAGAEHG